MPINADNVQRDFKFRFILYSTNVERSLAEERGVAHSRTALTFTEVYRASFPIFRDGLDLTSYLRRYRAHLPRAGTGSANRHNA